MARDVEKFVGWCLFILTVLIFSGGVLGALFMIAMLVGAHSLIED